MEISSNPPKNGLLQHHPVVTTQEWLEKRKELLIKEKELTRLQDAIAAKRRELPWIRIEKNYVFDAPEGKMTFSELFKGRSQLIVQHFMFGPGWQEGCPGCSFSADHVDSAFMHLVHNDVSFVAISRAPLSELLPFKERMGWKFDWVSSNENEFNFDFNVSFSPEQKEKGFVYYNYDNQPFESDELPGHSVFYKNEEGEIFHTYSAFARGAEHLSSAFSFLDMTPKGRNEKGPYFNLMDWVRHHDKYPSNTSDQPKGKSSAQAGTCCGAEGHSK
ncbi:MAG: DUF899 domain-containing protein [Bacteroidetes bacterium]|nr:MAG: DUF899 domain-containing protein [Bacteroidota bacterium]